MFSVWKGIDLKQLCNAPMANAMVTANKNEQVQSTDKTIVDFQQNMSPGFINELKPLIHPVEYCTAVNEMLPGT